MNLSFSASTSTSPRALGPFSSRWVKYFWLRVWKAAFSTRLMLSMSRYSSVTSTICRKRVMMALLVLEAETAVCFSLLMNSVISLSILKLRRVLSLPISWECRFQRCARVELLVAATPYTSILPFSSSSSPIRSTTDRQLQSRQMCLALILLPFIFSYLRAFVSRISSLLWAQYLSIRSYIFVQTWAWMRLLLLSRMLPSTLPIWMQDSIVSHSTRKDRLTLQRVPPTRMLFFSSLNLARPRSSLDSSREDSRDIYREDSLDMFLEAELSRMVSEPLRIWPSGWKRVARISENSGGISVDCQVSSCRVVIISFARVFLWKTSMQSTVRSSSKLFNPMAATALATLSATIAFSSWTAGWAGEEEGSRRGLAAWIQSKYRCQYLKVEIHWQNCTALILLMFLRVSRYLVFSSIILKMLGRREHSSAKTALNLRQFSYLLSSLPLFNSSSYSVISVSRYPMKRLTVSLKISLRMAKCFTQNSTDTFSMTADGTSSSSLRSMGGAGSVCCQDAYFWLREFISCWTTTLRQETSSFSKRLAKRRSALQTLILVTSGEKFTY